MIFSVGFSVIHSYVGVFPAFGGGFCGGGLMLGVILGSYFNSDILFDCRPWSWFGLLVAFMKDEGCLQWV